MAENKYVGGIQINTAGFEVKAAAPIDSRLRVKNADGLLELLTYEGLVSFNEADKKYYKFTDGEWHELSINTPEELEALIKALIGTETTGAMEFKGATASLPANPGKGDMYKVSATFAVGDETAKMGDTIVYNGEQWFLIPSGDDIEDTWRPVKVGDNTLDQSETLEFVAGENVTISEDGGKVTISSSYEDTHYESKIVVGNESADAADETVTENGNVHFNLIENGEVKSSHKIVGKGGITVTHEKASGDDSENVITIEAPEGAKYDLSAKTESGEAIISLAGTDSTEDKVAIIGGDAVTVTVENGKVKVSAPDTTYSGSDGDEIEVEIDTQKRINATIKDAAVSTAKIADKAVTAAKLADDAKALFKAKQQAKNLNGGSTVKTITSVSQNENGEVDVTYENIAFPDAPKGTGAVAIATKNDDGSVTINGGAKLNDHTLEDDTSKADVTLHKVATTGSIYDVTEGSRDNKGVDKDEHPKYIVFNCGSSTKVI